MSPQVVYSLHDVTPAHEALVLHALDRLRAAGASRLVLLVVPNFHGQAPLQRAPSFLRAIRQRLRPGDELALHGFFHKADCWPSGGVAAWKARHLTANEGEFAALRWAEALERMIDGREIVQDCLEQEVQGFVAPAWLDTPDVRRAVADAGLRWSEDHVWIREVRGGRRRAAPAVTLASRTPLRAAGSWLQARAALTLLEHAPLVRVAAHPADFRLPRLATALTDVVQHWSARREAVVPGELWGGWKPFAGFAPEMAPEPPLRSAQPGPEHEPEPERASWPEPDPGLAPSAQRGATPW